MKIVSSFLCRLFVNSWGALKSAPFLSFKEFWFASKEKNIGNKIKNSKKVTRNICRI